MAKKRIFSVTKALMLSGCLMLGTLMSSGVVTAYAYSDGSTMLLVDDDQTDPGGQAVPDYTLEISTSEEDFGTITQGDKVDPIEFTVKNTGETEFTLACGAFYDVGAFLLEPVEIGNPTLSEDGLVMFDTGIDGGAIALAPGDELVFEVRASDNLEPGDYRVAYEFYPAEAPEARVAATFYVSVKAPVPSISDVVVTPSNASILVGKSYVFKAEVQGKYDFSHEVSWKVTGNSSSATKISPEGILTIGNDENASNLIVTATSKQDPSCSGTASVNVQFIEYDIQLLAEPSDGGVVSGGGTVRTGGNLRATATANDYYTFSGWYEGTSLVSTSAQIQISNITYDRSFTAVFKKVRYTVSATISPSGAGRVENTGTYDGGETVVLRAIPNDGYDFSGWIMDSQNVSGDLEFVYGPLEKNISLTASFKAKEPRTFRIESGVANEGGKINPSGENYVQEGKSTTYKMVPDSGYRVHAVAVDGVNIGAIDSYTFSNVYDEHSIAVSFEPIPKEAATSSNSDENKKNSQSDGSQDKSKKTAEETEAEKEKAANEAEDQQTKPGLIERIPKEEVTEGASEEKAEKENNVISSRELYDRTYTLEDEAAPLAASAEPLMTTKPSMAQKSNFILRIIVGTLLAIVFASIGYTYFWLFRKGPSDDE